MPDSAPLTDRLKSLHDQLTSIVGDANLMTDEAALEPYVTEVRGRYHGSTPFLVKPGTTEELSKVMAACYAAEVAMVPQGGNTSLVGGSIPFQDRGEVIISTARMNKIREIDAENFTLTAEAGVILQEIQNAASEADRLFPLSLGAQGTCQIGGNISTNAGGVQVLRYGNTRDLVLGIEAVLPDGRVWNGLRGLRKDNTGYDLKHLFIGGEGTLGMISAATLKLYAKPREVVTAFCAVRDVAGAVSLLGQIRQASGENVTSFELLPDIAIRFAEQHVAGTRHPLESRHDWYVLIELYGGRKDGGLREALEEALMAAYEDGLVLDATLAESEAQSQALWRLREAIVEGQKHEGGSIKHDVSVPVSRIPEFMERSLALVEEMVPGIRPVPFGHVGDGNIHFNLTQPEGADKQAYLARWDEVNAAVHDIVHDLGGSISAEHGLGRMKIAENERFKQPLELEMMRAVKQAFDPKGLMNPGKML